MLADNVGPCVVDLSVKYKPGWKSRYSLRSEILAYPTCIRGQRQNIAMPFGMEQELSYRQQIARQLCTQYAEGIYRLTYYTVTFKSRLRVTQGHCKRNHWIDHTRLSSSLVI